jgi:hypothetical protein
MEEKIQEIVEKMIEHGCAEDDAVLQLLNNKTFKWDNPEQIYCLYTFQNQEVMKSALKKIYPQSDINSLVFLFQNYGYLENQIKFVLDDFSYQGAICDKARWALRQWFYYLTGKDTDEITERKWFHPNFGNANFWIQFCEVSMNIYYYGLTDNNIDFMRIARKIARETYYE